MTKFGMARPTQILQICLTPPIYHFIVCHIAYWFYRLFKVCTVRDTSGKFWFYFKWSWFYLFIFAYFRKVELDRRSNMQYAIIWNMEYHHNLETPYKIIYNASTISGNSKELNAILKASNVRLISTTTIG